MLNNITLETFASDIITCKKIKENPEYEERIRQAIEGAKTLDVKKDIHAYTLCQKNNIPQFQGIKFLELTYLERIKDPTYFLRLNNVLEGLALSITDHKQK